jgi:hypothetical protein
VSGADGRGGRKTVYRPGAAASMSSMSSWGEEDELSSSRFAKKRAKLDGAAGAAGVSQKVRALPVSASRSVHHPPVPGSARLELEVASLSIRQDTHRLDLYEVEEVASGQREVEPASFPSSCLVRPPKGGQMIFHLSVCHGVRWRP